MFFVRSDLRNFVVKHFFLNLLLTKLTIFNRIFKVSNYDFYVKIEKFKMTDQLN